jgi:hypothetical protein
MDVLLANHFSNLSTRGRTLIEYVFITNGAELRSATKILDRKPVAVADVPIWSQSLDGSMFYLKPRSMHPDPLRWFDGAASASLGRQAPARGLAHPVALWQLMALWLAWNARWCIWLPSHWLKHLHTAYLIISEPVVFNSALERMLRGCLVNAAGEVTMSWCCATHTRHRQLRMAALQSLHRIPAIIEPLASEQCKLLQPASPSSAASSSTRC